MIKKDLTISEFAEALGIAECTVWRWIKKGDVEAYKVGRHARIRREELEAFKQRNKIIPAIIG